MAHHVSKPAQSTPVATQHAVQVRHFAAQAWTEMEAWGVLPTPVNFDLWFTHVSGANQELSRRLTTLMNEGKALTAAALEGLQGDCMAPELDIEAVTDGVKVIQQAAQAVIDHVAGNGEELQRYGNTLSHCATQLGQKQTATDLAQAVAMLSAETVRAAARNRLLEQQLSASTTRIARLKDSLEEVKREATTDVLTGLWNRKAFDVRLRRALSRAKTEGLSLSVLLLDVDHFKRVNDSYGHHTGDLVLRLIGRLLTDSVKGRDTAARYGGEEFAILLAGADLQAGAIVADQIRTALAGKRLIHKKSGEAFGSITVSVGVAQFRLGEAAASLIARADAALYQAKHLGRNRVCTEEAPTITFVAA